jgi:hypothetical protein
VLPATDLPERDQESRLTPAGSPAGERPALRRWDPRRLPGWLQALLIFAASRLLTAFVIHRSARLTPVRPGHPRHDYWDILNGWDASWYARTINVGYPAHLPVGPDGAVLPNTWAFYPLFPRSAQLVMHLTGLSWVPAATLVSVSCAAVAVVVMRRVVAEVAGPQLALWTVALFCFFPSATVLQLPYAESLTILLLVVAFRLLQRGWYWPLAPVLLLIGLARPIAVPMAVVVTVHLAVRLRSTRRLRGNVGLLVSWAASGVAAVEWPLIAWYCTGVPDAYTRTMAGWRRPHDVIVLRPWVVYSEHVLGRFVGIAALALVVAAVGWWLFRPASRFLGADLLTWCAAYLVYLLAVLESFTSLPRYLLPLFPLGTLLAAQSSSRAFRMALTITGAGLGVVWVIAIWRTQHLAP